MANFHFGNLREEDGQTVMIALGGYIDACSEGANNSRYLPEIRQSLGRCIDHAHDIRDRLRTPAEPPASVLAKSAENARAARLLAQFFIGMETNMPTSTRQVLEHFSAQEITILRSFAAKVWNEL